MPPFCKIYTREVNEDNDDLFTIVRLRITDPFKKILMYMKTKDDNSSYLGKRLSISMTIAIVFINNKYQVEYARL